MIEINKNSSNNVVMTLGEGAISGSGFYTFEFINDMTNVTVSASAQNISSSSRYDEFVFHETSSAYVTSSQGVINLDPAGYWTYKAYEAYTSESLDTVNNYGLVETGKMIVIASGSTSQYGTYSNTKTYGVYKRD